jgi:Family of unknown function (DUF6232)
MAVHFRERDLQVTDDWIRSSSGNIPIRELRSVWVQLPRATRGRRFGTMIVLVGLVLLLFAWAWGSGWLTHNAVMIPGFLVLFVIAAWGGLLDPVAVYMEKRRHELWVSTDAYSVKIWANNNVEVNKAVRAIQRAQERLRDAQEF